MIHLLRAINVGGHNKISMALLRSCYERLQIENVQTYIQSGNVYFRSNKNIENSEIEKSIVTVTGLPIHGFLFSNEEWLSCLEYAPAWMNNTNQERKSYFTFTTMEITPLEFDMIAVEVSSSEQIAYFNRVLYHAYPSSLKQPCLTAQKLEKILKRHSTSRNWNTVQAMKMLIDSANNA